MKNLILKTITLFNVILFIVGACAIDSESLLPAGMCGIALLWLLPFMLINRDIIFSDDYYLDSGDDL